MPPNEPAAIAASPAGLATWKRIAIAAAGGLVVVFVKIYFQDFLVLSQHISNLVTTGTSAGSTQFIVTYVLLFIVMLFFGGVAGFLTTETNSAKLLAIGMAAPGLLGTMAGGEKTQIGPGQIPDAAIENQIGPAGFLDGFPIPSAFAQTPATTGKTDEPSAFGVFLGLSDTYKPVVKAPPRLQTPTAPQKYWVIVGSHQNLEDARKQAEAIAKFNTEIQPFVGERKPGNPYYPVIVGGKDAYYPLAQAEALRKKAEALPMIGTDIYLSPFPDRVPGAAGPTQ